MAQSNTWRARRRRFIHRVHARRAGRADITTRFVTQPEPRTIGQVARGQQLIAGNFLFSGHMVEGPDRSIWDVTSGSLLITNEIQGCAWLDDLVAVGTEDARLRAQTWIFDWIDRFGDGNDAGWTPGVTGRRLIRWINHAQFILRGQDAAHEARFLQSLARQTLFLSQRWRAAPPSLHQLEAIAGMIYAGFTLHGMQDHVAPAVAALATACQTRISADGGIATRNPEELLETLMLLNLTRQVLDASGQGMPGPILDAIEQIAPTLRAVRHADGDLARFHGGGRGVDGRLDEALAATGVKTLPTPGLHMGYARVTGARTSLVVDAAAPPSGLASLHAHASTLAFELTSGRRPLVVSCGSGARFGDDWRRASRATPSHSTMMLDGVSSSHLAPPDRSMTRDDLLTVLPGRVQCDIGDGDGPRKLEMAHNGYQPSHGLTHARVLTLSVDGRTLTGEDHLIALTTDDKSVFDQARAETNGAALPYSLRFHLHPDVAATVVGDGSAVSLTLKSGEIWLLQHDGTADLALSPSVYLENGRLKPRTTQQVVLSGRAMSYATRVRWSLAKTQDTPTVVRDLGQADPLDPSLT
ncbi:heparinase II/III family protein [Loktanella sp. Alg231-35]|uniref:heparinase II/III family protein n=1 Tax=Loktanella sp. Alg231-35 TaxID=1922220 RepID=UPI000D55F9EC|nr:heparinase II/III family protein [Loktanella sp. Alg231-35]